MDYVIRGIDPAPFAPLWSLDDAALAAHHARRVTVASFPGYPDRIGLDDAAVGETVLLVNHEHLPVDSPYRSRYAIYVREGQAAPAEYRNAIPPALARRTLSLRAFSAGHLAIDARLVEGAALAAAITDLFANPDAAYLHVHYATFGCFAARVDRAGSGPA